MEIFVQKLGTTKKGNKFCTFIVDFGNGFIINSLAFYNDVELKENTKYSDLYLEYKTMNGLVRFVIHNKK